MLTLAFFRFSPRETAFISWVGLRGATPIILATFPVVAAIPDGKIIFDVVFCCVGHTVRSAACWTDPVSVRATGDDLPERRATLPVSGRLA